MARGQTAAPCPLWRTPSNALENCFELVIIDRSAARAANQVVVRVDFFVAREDRRERGPQQFLKFLLDSTSVAASTPITHGAFPRSESFKIPGRPRSAKTGLPAHQESALGRPWW